MASPTATELRGGEHVHADDLALARLALTGSSAARARLASRLQVVPRVISVLNLRMGAPLGPEDCEDAAQDAVAAVWRRLPTYEGRSALESWAYRFCQNVLSQRLRAVRRRPRQVEAKEEAFIETGSEPRFSVDDFGFVYRALEQLEPQTDAELVRLKHFEGMTFEQLGATLDVSPNTAKTRYYRTLRRLRAALRHCQREGDL